MQAASLREVIGCVTNSRLVAEGGPAGEGSKQTFMLELISAKLSGTSQALTVRGEGPKMQDETNARYKTGNPLSDAVSYISDATYALLPSEFAHKLGELEKSLWSAVRGIADKELGWIDERVEGGDRLRNEWKESCRRADTQQATEPIQPES